VIIEESDFKLTAANDYSTFDLELMYVVNAKDSEKRREEFKDAGYNMSLEKCIQLIINYRLHKRIDVTSLKEYLKEYREERQKLMELVNLK